MTKDCSKSSLTKCPAIIFRWYCLQLVKLRVAPVPQVFRNGLKIPVTWQGSLGNEEFCTCYVNRLHGLYLGIVCRILILPATTESMSFVKDVSFPLCSSLDKISSEFLKEVFRGKLHIVEKISSFQEKSSRISRSNQLIMKCRAKFRQAICSRKDSTHNHARYHSRVRVTLIPTTSRTPPDSWASAITHSPGATFRSYAGLQRDFHPPLIIADIGVTPPP